MKTFRSTALTSALFRALGGAASLAPQRATASSSPSFRLTTTSHPRLALTSKSTRSLPRHLRQYLHTTPPLFARPPPPPRQIFPRNGRLPYDAERHASARPLLAPSHLKLISLLSIGSAVIFYVSNLETVPVSGRRRFNCFSEESAEAQGAIAYRQIIEEEGRRGRILPPEDWRTRMVERVLGRLAEGGGLAGGSAEGWEGEGKGSGWEVKVIDDDSTRNAFVLPGGKVFVYSGILPITRNDSGLAAVLGHEIAHNLCGHMAERMSSMVMIQPILWGLMYMDIYFTGTTSGFGRYLGSLLLDLGVMRPSSRQQESEADFVGLLLMARSCYDPRQAVGLWERMEQAEKGAPMEWLSTHPSNEHRIQRITEWLPKAQEARSNSGCGVTLGYAEDFKNAVQDTFW